MISLLRHFLAFWHLVFEIQPPSPENLIDLMKRARMTKTTQTKRIKCPRKFPSVELKKCVPVERSSLKSQA